MKSVQKIDLGLTGYDELFMNDAGRKENKLPRIYDIPISEIDDFPDHPFKVKLDEDMDQLVQSIKERGIITPVTLRPKENGRYEIVSGHRRKKACELAGFDTVKAEVREMTRDEAIILMVESNLQRSVILPSEKAFSYKMRLEAMRPNYLTEYFPKYIAKHGMPKMRFHDLRHSCASLLLANGVPLKQIQEWLGHSDFRTTANIYAHLDYRSKISSAQAMEQGMLLPRSDDFGSRWENVTEQGKITEPDLNPRTLADQTISSVVRLWQIHLWSRSFQVAL